MDFEIYLKNTAQSIEKELEKILINFLKETKQTSPKLIPFALALINSCKGGKKIRGVLCKLGYELASSKFKVQSLKVDGEIYKIGAAYEILHTALLIHDDIMDKSPIRRGKSSLYKSLGISQAINIADIGLYLPIKIIAESGFSAEKRIKAISLLSQTIINTGWGQVMDIELVQSSKFKAQSDDKEFVNLYKTAKYTIAAPLQIGAILAGSDLVDILGKFGERLGIAFQIQDDVLDNEGEVDSREKALKYAQEARNIIPNLTSDGKMHKLLKSMCEFMIGRTI
jgi:geranylgeranyl pyrophosphate synthase